MKFLSNFSIGVRLAAAFSALVVLIALAIAFALNQADRIGGSSRVLALKSLHNVMLARDAQRAAQTGTEQLNSLFTLPERAQRVPIYAQIDRNVAIRDAAISELFATADSPAARQILQEVARSRDIFVPAFIKTVNEVEQDVNLARKTMVKETTPALRSMLDALDKLVLQQSNQAEATIQSIRVLQADSRQSILLLGLVFVLGATMLALVITRSITVPLAQTSKFAKEIEIGNFTSNSPDAGRCEVGALIKTLDVMRTSIAARESRITELAYKDALTGLPNRMRFNDLLQQAAKTTTGAGQVMSILIMDLDRFKQVNDVLGHHVGDQLLIEVSKRLQNVVLRKSDIVARIGGDEFAVLLPDRAGEDAITVAQRILKALDAPLELQGQFIDISGSIGISAYPKHGIKAAELMSRADIAMYVAKQSGNGYALFDQKLDQCCDHGLSLLTDLRRAIEDHEFILHFQPKIELATGICCSAEVLIRWNHPTRGWIAPDQFIPFAERTGFIRVITRWVLENACAQAAEWCRQGTPLGINVNISTRDLINQDFPALASEILQNTGLPTSLLCLEITEGAVMDDPLRALTSLQSLDAMGIKMSIDDFGTGYSSLAYLKKLPVQELKIDRSFVMHMDANIEDEVIVRSTIELAHNMNMKVVAEGVEHAQVVDRLKQLGCDQAQGYFFSRPLPAAEFSAWASKHRVKLASEITANPI